jgi:hypothetical protein
MRGFYTQTGGRAIEDTSGIEAQRLSITAQQKPYTDESTKNGGNGRGGPPRKAAGTNQERGSSTLQIGRKPRAAGFLEGFGDGEKEFFLVRAADELEVDGESFRGAAEGKG